MIPTKVLSPVWIYWSPPTFYKRNSFVLWLLSGVLTVCLSLLASSGSYGERDGVGWGCDCERRALPERCQRAASQIHQRIGPRATNHHVTSCGAKKKKQPFIWTQLKTQTVPERERERAVKEKRKKEQNNVFSLILIRLNSFLALLGCTVHQSEMMSIWFVKKSSPAHQTGL